MKFTIDGFEFGVDADKSSLLIETGKNGTVLLSAEICGAAESIEQLDVDHPFGWLVFPPTFYVRDLESRSIDGVCLKAEFNRDDLDDIDSAMIMVEHRDVDEVKLHVAENLSISGKVPLSSGWEPFQIELERNLIVGSRIIVHLLND